MDSSRQSTVFRKPASLMPEGELYLGPPAVSAMALRRFDHYSLARVIFFGTWSSLRRLGCSPNVNDATQGNTQSQNVEG